MMTEVVPSRTHSQLRDVPDKVCKEEIARMLGGKSDSALTLAGSCWRDRLRSRYRAADRYVFRLIPETCIQS